MSFEIDEIGSLLEKLVNEKNELEVVIRSLSSAPEQVGDILRRIEAISGGLQSSLGTADSDLQRLDALVGGFNQVISTVRTKHDKIIESLHRTAGQHEKLVSIISSLKESRERIEMRNKSQEALIKKIKEEGTDSKSKGKKSTELRKIGSRSDGISKKRRAIEKMEKDELLDIQKDDKKDM